MHDRRFLTLDEVLNHYSDHVKKSKTLSHELANIGTRQLALSGRKKKDLIAFLYLLTDSSFIKQPELGDPHIQ